MELHCFLFVLVFSSILNYISVASVFPPPTVMIQHRNAKRLEVKNMRYMRKNMQEWWMIKSLFQQRLSDFNYTYTAFEKREPIKYLDKNVLVCDVHILNFQFGHVVNGATQMASYVVESNETFDLIIMANVTKRAFSSHALNIIKILDNITGIPMKYGLDEDFGYVSFNSTTVFLPDELPFRNALTASRWQSVAAGIMQYNPEIYSSQCPPFSNTITIISRGEKGRADRTLLNIKEIMLSLKRRYPCVNVSNARFHSLNTTMEQISPFLGSTLILSTHSSQLKNIIFSPKGSAILEIGSEYLSDALAMGSDTLQIFYHYSHGHVRKTHVNEKHSIAFGAVKVKDKRKICNVKFKKGVNCNVVVNMTKLISEIDVVMTKQRARCPQLWPCM